MPRADIPHGYDTHVQLNTDILPHHTYVDGVPRADFLHGDDKHAQLNSVVLQDQTRVDGVPKGQLPDKFIHIASRIDKLHLRPMFNNVNTVRFLEDVIRKVFGKGKLGDAINDTKKNKRVKRQEVNIATLCPDGSCIELLKQYEQWRQEHGYAYYTGVWKVGK